MNIYLLSQSENTDYDTYDSITVCAKNPTEARTIDPHGDIYIEPDKDEWPEWASTKKGIKVKLIGKANKDQKKGVILASFNAG